MTGNLAASEVNPANNDPTLDNPANNVGTISATHGQKEQYCNDRANAVLLTKLLPGGDVLAGVVYGGLKTSDINTKIGKQVATKTIETAGASSAFKYWFRGATGVPMSTTAKFAGWLGAVLTAKDIAQAWQASVQEYRSCVK